MAYITLIEAKTHCNVDYSDDDTYITSLIDLVEALVKTEISGTFTGYGTVGTAATTALVGTDTNFADFAIGDSIYVDGETERIIATITDDEALTVTLAFSNTASDLGYSVVSGLPLVGAALVPQLRHAMLLMIRHYYIIREPINVGNITTELEYTFKFLIAPFKNYTIA